ncbi:serum response factor-binding protein 1 [Candoia aspera]|uniref:serum response factor-binding protein 1 n=1 Tax=Candoia aspera TaxID=51853 RepID=UPI002FD7A7BA
MAQVLNLNNEVVKMRKEVKKIRVLTIRKLTRHITKLKGKKGTEDAVLKNHRRAQRLLEEIHAMKEIKLDQVTKSALGREIDFGIICKKPNSTARDRAIARLMSHPLLKTKIANIKAAVEAFKNARQKPTRAISSKEQELEQQLNKHPGETQHSINSETLKQAESQDKTKANEKPKIGMGKKHIFESEMQKMAESVKKHPSYTSALLDTEHHKLIHQIDRIGNSEYSEENVHLADIVNKRVGDSDRDPSKSEESGKEEYFDDSTEERFYNQSSSTDESNNNDDFFIGKVKRMKKRRATNTSQPTEQKIRNMLLKKPKDPQCDMMPGTNSKDSNQSSKAGKLESVFYYSLSSTQKPEHVKRSVRDHLPRNKKTFEKNHPQKQRPKSSAVKCNTEKNPSEQPLHPSWEASRKLREQMSQITVFQGKKIKFED